MKKILGLFLIGCLSISVFELNGADYASPLIEQYEKPGGLLDPAKSTEPTHEQQKAAQSWMSRAASGVKYYAGRAVGKDWGQSGKPEEYSKPSELTELHDQNQPGGGENKIKR